MPLMFELCPGRMIGGTNPCFIIAEIGQNHQGDIKIAKKMIKMAKDCGADCAKFQKSELEHKFNKQALERLYTSKNSWGRTYGDHKRHLEFSHEQYRELQKYAEEVGIFFHRLWDGRDGIASLDANNFPYLEKCAKKGRPMVVSSGMQSMETMRRVYQTVKEHNPNFTFLQCTSAYPLDPEDVNLRVIAEYQKEFPDIPIGELTELVRSIRLVERAMGTSIKTMLPCEKACHDKLGKSPMGVAAEDIFQLVGKTVKEDVEEDDSVLPAVVEGYCKKC
ncbi:hypothetical protein KUCAC02_013433 [Chaenocephalus aceratus]|nr:hypothetical protein KUCAC02_013433 [Chaenocephalus aceratus]